MLLDKVRVHNAANGFRFTAAEFSGIILVLLPFAMYYWLDARWTLALIVTGIVVNCVPVVIAAARSIRDGDRAVGWRGVRDHDALGGLGSDPAHLLTDTVVIAVCTLIPFLGAALAAADLVNGRRSP